MTSSGTCSKVKKAPIRLAGHDGWEVTANPASPDFAGPGFDRARLYSVGNRLYRLLAVVPNSKPNKSAIAAFVDSFELLRDRPDITRPPETSKPGLDWP